MALEGFAIIASCILSDSLETLATKMNRYSLSGLVVLSMFALISPCWADDYQFGQGLQLDNFLVSGYANVTAERPRGKPAALSVDDLALFVSGRVNRWLNPFLEAEISGANLWQQGSAPASHGTFVMERFYDDITLTDSDTLRVGKILSPVGDWNLIHAAPLVPTTTRPLTTQRGFSEYANGLSWLRDSGPGAIPDWQFYWQPGKEWLPRPNSIAPERYRNVLGAHVNWSRGLSDKFGASFQQGQSGDANENYHLLGLNARKSFGRLILESEATHAQWTGVAARVHDQESGVYALADYSFNGRWHGLLEAEYYQSRHNLNPSKNTLLGVAYKAQPALVWKLEYVHQTGDSHTIPTGWLASLAVLF